MGTKPEDFTPEIYEVIREGAKRSAEVVVPLFREHYKPESVIDVGCGEGWWGLQFEGEVYGIEDTAEPWFPYLPYDLEKPLPPMRRFDLALALEVAEHLSPERADGFVADLCRLAPVVLFSAAIPGQGGTGHLNEQWPDYWVERFAAHGYTCSGALRWQIWNDDRVENWYRQNLLVAARNPAKLPGLFATPLAEVFPVVHPVLFTHVHDCLRP